MNSGRLLVADLARFGQRGPNAGRLLVVDFVARCSALLCGDWALVADKHKLAFESFELIVLCCKAKMTESSHDGC